MWNKKSKKIISISIILILAVTTIIAVGAVTGPYTGCVSTKVGKWDPAGIFYNFKAGSTPIYPCNSGDVQFSLYDKTYIDNVISGIQTQITNLVTRITNIENNNALLSRAYVLTGSYSSQSNVVPNGIWQDIINWNFYVPVDSYAYIESSGNIINQNTGPFLVAMGIDDRACQSTGVSTWACSGDIREIDASQFPWTGYQMSREVPLLKGYHRIYLQGIYQYGGGAQQIWVSQTFNAMSSENKGISTAEQMNNPNENVTVISKDGKITIKSGEQTITINSMK